MSYNKTRLINRMNVIEEMTVVYGRAELWWNYFSAEFLRSLRKIFWVFLDLVLFLTLPIWGWFGIKIVDYYWHCSSTK